MLRSCVHKLCPLRWLPIGEPAHDSMNLCRGRSNRRDSAPSRSPPCYAISLWQATTNGIYWAQATRLLEDLMMHQPLWRAEQAPAGVVPVGPKRALIYCRVSSPGQKENGSLE